MLYSFASVHIFFFFFFFFFPPRFCGRDISGTVTRRDSRLSVLLCPAVQFCTIAYHAIRFVIFFFSAKILSGPYLWNRYSQRLQIECAAWSCGLILHYYLPSNSLRYFFFLICFSRHDFATILSGPYLWNRYSQRLQIECAAWSCGLIVHYCLPSNSLCCFFFFAFFRHDFVRAISLEPLLAETPN